MVQFNFAERTIKAKVVYYGPAQSGKTTNLEQIHRLTDPRGTSRLVSLNTGQDRTLFFDLLPFSLGNVAGYDFKLQLYTVPGQVQYNATRRVVLSGADGVVFVADSRRAMLKENLASLENMKVNLLANRLVPEKVPLVVQYNKRDLGEVLSLEELDAALNTWHRPAFASVAATGQGVMDAFIAAVQQMLGTIAAKYNLREKGLDPAAVPAVVAEAFANLMRDAAAATPPPEAGPARKEAARAFKVSQPHDPEAAEAAGVVPEELLQRALRSNVELAEALSGVVREVNMGLSTILVQAELLQVHREGPPEKREAAGAAIKREATRLRAIMEELGQAGAASKAAEPAEPPGSAPDLGELLNPIPLRDDLWEPSSPPLSPTFDALLRTLVTRVSSSQPGLAVEVRVPTGLESPVAPPDELQGALRDLLAGAVATATARSSFTVQADRKSVVLKGRDGEQRRDFVLVSVKQSGGPSTEDQTRIAAGDPILFGGSPRRVRALGGFIRFFPTQGGVEMRVFLPAG